MIALIGQRIREIRHKRGMTLNELASQIDVTASYISQVERDLIEPSLSSLRKIAVALGVPLFTFLHDDSIDPVVVRAAERKQLALPESSIIYEFVTPMVADQKVQPKMEIIYFTLAPKSWTSDENITHQADECVFVINGDLEIYLDDKKYCLQAGDSVYIKENIGHRFYNPTDKIVTGLTNITPAIY
ncbi:helix-turn-helix domain-containing protein [Natronincola ferrireducens]|uniref:Transcriptional regulator, contains XRE-family HTH domain n=1 Tax=Natronincola ferrireducens TaxID=393762 RepID=A0A1G8YXE7_9FIRM|nr:XRE family transcriptional regulator [Natronincola ferrireducens]SDK07473.1 Transcriptional regulator, contains XRE-family HTH domain [Natronincola ferrireducens]